MEMFLFCKLQILYKDSEHLGVKEETKDDNLESGLEEGIVCTFKKKNISSSSSFF